jgi:uncharacterized repeat protein (TIGR03803 family)
MRDYEEAAGVCGGRGALWDATGNLYGTNSMGGPSGLGVVFKVDTAGKERVGGGYRTVKLRFLLLYRVRTS